MSDYLGYMNQKIHVTNTDGPSRFESREDFFQSEVGGNRERMDFVMQQVWNAAQKSMMDMQN